MSNLLNVSQASRVMGMSIDTIRRWEKRGLIKARRSELNYRMFDFKELKHIQNKILGNSTANNYKILITKDRTIFTTIELFAGAGGTALGFENAGINHKLLNEWDKNCVSTLKNNRPGWNVIGGSVSQIDFKGMCADIVQGGFPCQAFSYAGNKLGFEDVRGTMFFEFARCVKEVMPKIAVGENVKGLFRHDNGRTLKTMVKILEEIGYRVKCRIMRSQYLDVPQKRERLIILAVRNDLDLPFLFPKEKDYTISIREALKGCPRSVGQQYPEQKKKVLELIPPGGYWRDLPVTLQKKYMGASYFMGGGKTGMARRLSWDEPCLTLTCSPAQKQTERCHPKDTRPLTVREYARIQTFPDNWKFEGSVVSQYKQIGNAVPVNLGYHLGRCLVAMLRKKPDPKTMELVKDDAQSTLF